MAGVQTRKDFVFRAVATVKDQKLVFSGGDPERPQAGEWRRRPARCKRGLVVETLQHLGSFPLCAATDNFLYFVGDLFDRHAIVGGYSDDGLEFERRRELPLLPVLRPRDQDPGLRALPHRLSKLLGDPVGPTPFLIEAEDNDDGVGARNVFFQWLQAYLSGIVLTAQNNRRDLGLLQRLGHGVLKFVTFRLTGSCIRAHDGKLLRPSAWFWCDVELAADVSDERVDVFRMD